MKSIEAIAARIAEIETEMKLTSFLSAERKALEDEKSMLVREREDLHRAAAKTKIEATRKPYAYSGNNPEFYDGQAENWEKAWN